MRKFFAFLLIISTTSVQSFAGVGPGPASSPVSVAQDYDQWEVSFTSDQLENLLAPIALYPDPLLAQVLLAATFPDQVDQAARTMRAYNNHFDIDSADWDVSVKAVAHYPSVLSMMADKIDWTTSVGQAYVNQSSDVMEAIQHLRRQARSVGNLVTTPQQEIVETDGYIYIYPAQPQYIYVPTYDPSIVYFRRPLFWGPVIGFGIGFVIGAWLNHDCDWRNHRVFYHGWEHGPIWAQRARPFIRINNIYVGRKHEDVIINRGVLDHHVNYGALDRYRAIHRDTDFGNVRHGRGAIGERRLPPGPAQPPHPDNQIIRRNIDPNDPRIDSNRGHGRPQPEVGRNFPRPDVHTPQPPVVQPPVVQPPQPRNNIQLPHPLPRTSQPPVIQPPQPRGNVQPPPPPPTPPSSVFRGNTGGIDWRDASRRGQASREQQNRPVPHANVGPPSHPGPPPGGAQQHGRRPR